MINKSNIEETVRFTINGKEIEGILAFPDAEAPYPVIILLHGSDRSDANSPYFTEHSVIIGNR